VTADARTFESLKNFRDAGGYAADGSRSVATGRLFRSDSLAAISPGDVELLRDLGVRMILDLRRPDEVERFGRIADAEWWRYHNIQPIHPLWDDASYDVAAGTARYLTDRYLELAEHGVHGLGAALRLLAEPTGTPAVVHCFAGKDRTGVVIALTLALLGVADEDIADDYARSDEWSRSHAPDDLPAHWIAAPREAMTIFLADLRERYGSVDRYAATAGVTDAHIAALRSTLLI
jgi:protein tyrosine/serine phosphatase